MKKFVHIVFLIIFLAGMKVNAQQYSITSQYLTNGLVLNPAYAGSRGALCINASYRQQWLKVTGAPQFENLTLHSPVNKNERIALGFMVNHITYGITHMTGVNAFYAYRFPVSSGMLSFGMNAGMDITNINYNDVQGIDHSDDLFAGAENYTLPNIGVGTYYYSNKIFAGLSVPSLLSYHEADGENYSVYWDYKKSKVFFTAGCLIELSQLFKIKPSVLLRYAPYDPLEADMNTTLIYADAISAGASYRIAEKAIVCLVDLQLTPQLKIGYSYDYQTGQLNNYTSGTHEISIRYEFSYKINAASPKYF